MRLNKFLSHSGITSRRKADDLIDKGKVSVNGKIVKEYWYDVDPDNDVVVADGKECRPSDRIISILFNKPPRMLVSHKSQDGKPIVFDYLPDFKNMNLYFAGRLDYLTEGALILTTDGNFANDLVHPSTHIKKQYEVLLDRFPSKEDIQKIKEGLMLDNTQLQPVKIQNIKPVGASKMCKIKLILEEGKKRQIRRMFKQLGYNVEHLRRLSIGGITVKGLEKGAWRYLTKEEIYILKTKIENNKKKYKK